jgi:hypothetical protein
MIASFYCASILRIHYRVGTGNHRISGWVTLTTNTNIGLLILYGIYYIHILYI